MVKTPEYLALLHRIDPKTEEHAKSYEAFQKANEITHLTAPHEEQAPVPTPEEAPKRKPRIRAARTAPKATAAQPTKPLTEKTLANLLDAALDGRFTYALKHQGGAWLRREVDGLWEPDENGAALRKIIRESMDAAPQMQKGSAVSGVEVLMRYGSLTDFEGGWDTAPETCGLPGGQVLDLKTGATRPGSRHDRITNRLGAVPRKWSPGTMAAILERESSARRPPRECRLHQTMVRPTPSPATTESTSSSCFWAAAATASLRF